MLSRSIAIYRSPYVLHELFFPFFNGVLQDGVVIFQALALMIFLNMLFGFKSGNTLFAMLYCNMIPFIDVLLQLEMYPRINLGFFINLYHNFDKVYPSLVDTLSWSIAFLLLAWMVFVLAGVSYISACSRATKQQSLITHIKTNMALCIMT